MLDLVKHETERIDSRFLEPACGNGNFLAAVLNRKLNVVETRYSKSQLEWELYAIIALSSIYGVDILEDNAAECRRRLYLIFKNRYESLFAATCKVECLGTAAFLLKRNILWGDALDFTNPETREPIIFSEWSAVSGFCLKRKDFVFKFLVEGSLQLSIFDENKTAQYFDKEIKDFPSIHFLMLGLDDTNEL